MMSFLGFALFHYIVVIIIIIGDRPVNVALQAVFKSRRSGVESPDKVQHFLTKVKTAIDDNTDLRSRRRTLGKPRIEFTEFLDEVINIVMNYGNLDLEDLVSLLNDEVKNVTCAVCDIPEILENKHLRLFVNMKLNKLQQSSANDVKKTFSKFLAGITELRTHKRGVELLDYLDLVYTDIDPQELMNVLYNLQVYKAKSVRAHADLERMVKRGFKSVVFDHYYHLDEKSRSQLKTKFENVFFGNDSPNVEIDETIQSLQQKNEPPKLPNQYSMHMNPMSEEDVLRDKYLVDPKDNPTEDATLPNERKIKKLGNKYLDTALPVTPDIVKPNLRSRDMQRKPKEHKRHLDSRIKRLLKKRRHIPNLKPRKHRHYETTPISIPAPIRALWEDEISETERPKPRHRSNRHLNSVKPRTHHLHRASRKHRQQRPRHRVKHISPEVKDKVGSSGSPERVEAILVKKLYNHRRHNSEEKYFESITPRKGKPTKPADDYFEFSTKRKHPRHDTLKIYKDARRNLNNDTDDSSKDLNVYVQKIHDLELELAKVKNKIISLDKNDSVTVDKHFNDYMNDPYDTTFDPTFDTYTSLEASLEHNITDFTNVYRTKYKHATLNSTVVTKATHVKTAAIASLSQNITSSNISDKNILRPNTNNSVDNLHTTAVALTSTNVSTATNDSLKSDIVNVIKDAKGARKQLEVITVSSNTSTTVPEIGKPNDNKTGTVGDILEPQYNFKTYLDHMKEGDYMDYFIKQ